ncbi:helix-turn-helix domain-containing protein [Streptomyces sp. SID3343]|uniref:winged helix-turn-helix transcriptional regulator n=1 Tax=Streptomyces sp. SID3343 TaxID=2690260 RepID=UPI00136DD412|nr:helix-turn-helix domain-containing protein [Streptomyces sp. SID3343]MYV99782.1 transcriptional regulator [Streptomyces sp. SID3343]
MATTANAATAATSATSAAAAGNVATTATDCPDPGYAPDPTPEFEFDVFAKACVSRAAMEHITGRWGVLVLGGLHDGPMRFNALRRRVEGVSEKMLSQTLQALERDGFVVRDVHSAIPPRVEYSLTDLGTATAARLLDLIRHLEGNMAQVMAAREVYDRLHGEKQ